MISDSSPLIFLSKIGEINLLEKIFKKIIITENVKDEVLYNKKEGYEIIQNAIDKKILVIKNPSKILDFGLGKGENSSINLAIELKDSLIIDDLIGIKVASSFSIETIRTTTLLFQALEKKIYSKKEVMNLIDQLIKNNYYIKPEYYIDIFKKLSS